MRIILDPILFSHFRNGSAVSIDAVEKFRKRLSQLIQVLRATGAHVSFESEAWRELYKRHISVAYTQCTHPDVKAAISILRRAYLPAPRFQFNVRTWGILSLLSSAGVDRDDWANAIAKSGAAELCAGNEVMLFTFLDEGRTCTTFRSEHSMLIEKTRWAIYVGAQGLDGASKIKCIASLRNCEVDWTTRFDDDLPDTAPTDGRAFIPPDRWWLRSVVAVRTIKSKSSWVDYHGNGWTPPNTPGVSYHWDVHFLEDSDSPNKLNPCNIVKHNVPPHEGTPGDIHHTPMKKRSRASSP